MPRPEEFRRKLHTLAAGGPANLCLISDFDQTLSKFYANGQLGHSTFKILELSGLFTPEFQEEMLRLYHYYQPIERNPDIPVAEKSVHMDSWWLLTYERYLTLDINKSQLLEMIKRANIQLRHGIDDLMNTCRKHSVPVKVISAGLGNFIDLLLTSAVGFDDADIVSNFMLFDESGRICGFSEPLIHSLKKSVALQNRPLAPNLMVLGDIPTDVDVIRDIKFEESLCIGFANDLSKIPLADYTERYDLLIFDDGDLDVADEVVKVVAGEASLDALLQRLTISSHDRLNAAAVPETAEQRIFHRKLSRPGAEDLAQSEHSLVYPVNPRQLQDQTRAYSNPRQVRSPSSAQIRRRIKITNKDKPPVVLKPDQERLIEEGLSLKMENNSFRDENLRLRTRINQLDKEIAKRDEFLDELRSKAGEKHYYVALKQGHLVSSLKQTVKELKTELKAREEELARVRKAVKFTQINEIEAELEAYIEECARLKRLLVESARPISRGRVANSIDAAQGQVIAQLNKDKHTLERTILSLQEELARVKQQRDRTPAKEPREAEQLQAEISRVKEDLSTKGKTLSQAEEKIRQQASAMKELQQQMQTVARERDSLRRRHDEVNENLRELQERLAVVESREIQVSLHFFVNKLASKKLSFLSLLQSFPSTGTFQDLMQVVEEARVVIPEQYWSALCKHYISDRGTVDVRRLVRDVEPIRAKVRETPLLFFAKKKTQQTASEVFESPAVEDGKTVSSREVWSSQPRDEVSANCSGTREREEEPEEILEKKQSLQEVRVPSGSLRIEAANFRSSESMDSIKAKSSSSSSEGERYEADHFSESSSSQREVPEDSVPISPKVATEEGCGSQREAIVTDREKAEEAIPTDRESEKSQDYESEEDQEEQTNALQIQRRSYSAISGTKQSSSQRSISPKDSEKSLSKKQSVAQSSDSFHTEQTPQSVQSLSHQSSLAHRNLIPESHGESQEDSKLPAAPIDFSRGETDEEDSPRVYQFVSSKPSQSVSNRDSYRNETLSQGEASVRQPARQESMRSDSTERFAVPADSAPPMTIEENAAQESEAEDKYESERQSQFSEEEIMVFSYPFDAEDGDPVGEGTIAFPQGPFPAAYGHEEEECPDPPSFPETQSFEHMAIEPMTVAPLAEAFEVLEEAIRKEQNSVREEVPSDSEAPEEEQIPSETSSEEPQFFAADEGEPLEEEKSAEQGLEELPSNHSTPRQSAGEEEESPRSATLHSHSKSPATPTDDITHSPFAPQQIHRWSDSEFSEPQQPPKSQRSDQLVDAEPQFDGVASSSEHSQHSEPQEFFAPEEDKQSSHHSDEEAAASIPAATPPDAPALSSRKSSVPDPLIEKTKDNIEKITKALKDRNQSVREAFEDLGTFTSADLLYGIRALGLGDFPLEEFQMLAFTLGGDDDGIINYPEMVRVLTKYGVRSRPQTPLNEVSVPEDSAEVSLGATAKASVTSDSERVHLKPLSATGSVIAAQQYAEQTPVSEIHVKEVLTSEAEESRRSANSESFYEYAGEGN